MDRASKFTTIDYGTRVSTTELQQVVVEVDPAIIIKEYAKATLLEMNRMNPVRFQSVAEVVTEESLAEYFSYLVCQRVKYVQGDVQDWRKMRTLWVPAWIQFALACVGEVIVTDFGVKFTPSVASASKDLKDYVFEDASVISDILRMFKVDGLSVLDDAFPKTKDGQKDTMSLALIGSYVKGMWPVSHPIYTYVAAFLGFKILESTGFSMLYRCRYDEVSFIASMLLRDERVIR